MTSIKSKPKVALVADWLTNMGGAERLLLSLHEAFPDAPIYTSVFDAEACPEFKDLDIRTSYLQKLPESIRYRHQLFPTLRAGAFRKLDMDEYDIIVSSSSAEAKSVIKRPDALHVCYCHTPIRYYWSHYKEYMKDPGFGSLNGLVRTVMPGFVARMKRFDLASVNGVDLFVANSHEVQKRIKQYYRRDAKVIFPPVDTVNITPVELKDKEDFYLVVARQIPYKKVDIAIKACNRLKKRLVVIGRGGEHDALRTMAGETIEFITDANDATKADYLRRAKAFLFPSFEDFGIAPVEAIAAGTPVIAYEAGGAHDYIREGVNGMFFEQQTPRSLEAAIKVFERKTFDPIDVSITAECFSEARFVCEIRNLVLETYKAHTEKQD